MEGVGENAGRIAARIPVLSHPPTIPVAISPERPKPLRTGKAWGLANTPTRGYNSSHPQESHLSHTGIQLAPPGTTNPAEEAAASGSSQPLAGCELEIFLPHDWEPGCTSLLQES